MRADSSSMKFHIITAVWGDEYTRLFLDTALPNQLSPGNLGAFLSGPQAVYKIYTATTNVSTIKQSAFYEDICKIMPVEFIILDDLRVSEDHETSMELMTRCHKMAISSAEEADAFLIFLPPDQVWSDGSFARLIELAAAGKRVVVTAGVRVSKETFIPEFTKTFRDSAGHFPAPSRELVRIAMNSLHPLTRSYFTDAHQFNIGPSHLYWRVGKEGMIARCLSMHPALVKPAFKNTPIKRSIDDDYLIKACPDFSDYHVICDSDEIAAFEITTSKWNHGVTGPNRFNMFTFAHYMKFYGHRIHKNFLRHKVLFHSSALDSEWDRAAEASDNTIDMAFLLKAVSYKSWGHSTFFGLANINYPQDHVRRVVVFGTGKGGLATIDLAERLGWEIMYFTGNDSGYWGKTAHGYNIKSLEALYNRDYDLIIVASQPGKKAIFIQLKKMGFRFQKDFIYFMDPVCVNDYYLAIRNPVKIIESRSDYPSIS